MVLEKGNVAHEKVAGGHEGTAIEVAEVLQIMVLVVVDMPGNVPIKEDPSSI